MKIDVIKVHAQSYKRSMRVILPDGFECSCFIPEKLYVHLKMLGVMTSQKLRFLKDGDKK